MKVVLLSVFAFIMTAATSFAGGCSKHEHTNLEDIVSGWLQMG